MSRASRAVAFFVLAACGAGMPDACGAPAPTGDWRAVAAALAAGGSTDFTPHGTQPGLFYRIDAAGSCQSCHGVGGSAPPSAPTFLPYATWSGSMMANATRDPLFFAALDVANHDVPGIGDYCLRCHTSTGWYNGDVVKAGAGSPDNDVARGAAACLLEGRYDYPDNNSDYGGVACHYCHRLVAQGPNGEPPLTGNGNAWVDDQDCSLSNPASGGGPCRRGPFDYAPTATAPPHPWQASAFHADSALCGTCHDVSTPDLAAGPLRTLKLGDGSDSGRPFPIERTYSEWRQSRYAQAPQTTCQNCHMPVSEDPGALACVLDGYPNRSGELPVHAFVGGNTWVPQIIKGEYGSGLGGNRRAALDQTTAWARQQLQAAAAVATRITSFTPPGGGAGTLALAVTVTNLSGHKLPTGYGEGRRMWLNLQIHDAHGALILESAAYDAASGVLGRDGQARVYEVLQGIFNQRGTGTCDIADADGAAMFHFALNDCVASDTRIPPLGLRPASADDPQGYDLRPLPLGSYPETTAGSGVLVNYDVVHYSVAVAPGTPLPLVATARLYYQTASRDYIEFLRREALDHGFAGENALCAGGPQRPFPVGPGERSRGEYLHALWSAPLPGERVFGDGFDGTSLPLGYGRSPPELLGVGSANTSATTTGS